jgi:hypothetical protein
VRIELHANTSAFELRGLVAPGAGTFTVSLDPPVGTPFVGNTGSEVTDPATLLYAIGLDTAERYEVDIESASALPIHLGSWSYAVDW